MSWPLIDALTEKHGVLRVTEASLMPFSQTHEHALLFFAGDPRQHPEALDVSVILPELLKHFESRFAAALVDENSAEALQRRYGFDRCPALVFLKRGQYVGAIAGIRDWRAYIEEIESVLGSEPKRPPSIGIPVVAPATGSCH